MPATAAEIDEAATFFGVPEADRAAFAEFYEKKHEDSGGKLRKGSLQQWRSELAEKPAEVQVRSFMKQHETQIAELIASLGAKREVFEQTMIFTSVYGVNERGKLSMEDALQHVVQNFRAAAEGKARGEFKLSFRRGSFDQRHFDIRVAAFPYRPASCTSRGDQTFDCWAPDGTLVGYIGYSSAGYIDDLAVHPSWQGRKIARGLVCSAANQLLESGGKRICLHVRALNYPAIGLYKSLGFSMTDNIYPGWYDWHGGYEMDSGTSRLASMLE